MGCADAFENDPSFRSKGSIFYQGHADGLIPLEVLHVALEYV
jgi:hypothetical protein